MFRIPLKKPLCSRIASHINGGWSQIAGRMNKRWCLYTKQLAIPLKNVLSRNQTVELSARSVFVHLKVGKQAHVVHDVLFLEVVSSVRLTDLEGLFSLFYSFVEPFDTGDAICLAYLEDLKKGEKFFSGAKLASKRRVNVWHYYVCVRALKTPLRVHSGGNIYVKTLSEKYCPLWLHKKSTKVHEEVLDCRGLAVFCWKNARKPPTVLLLQQQLWGLVSPKLFHLFLTIHNAIAKTQFLRTWSLIPCSLESVTKSWNWLEHWNTRYQPESLISEKLLRISLLV